jgi:hypothetical protein
VSTPTSAPTGSQVYSGQHFTLTYPTGWTLTTSPAQTGLMGDGIILTDPAAQPPAGPVTVTEAWGYSPSQLQALCQLPGTAVRVAGLSMKYTIGEGVHRNWLFVNSQGVAFTLDAMDANQSLAVQQQHNAILATFRPDDGTTACA